MSQDSIVVGKHVLESLTLGMYTDPKIIFREYVQNATDAIDKAIAASLIQKENGRIDITIDPAQKEIRIRDNGMGVPKQDVYHTLGDIGNSEKKQAKDRGFRGIGRLGGLGYCTELEFMTSYQGENCKTIMHWNAQELKRLLQPQNTDYEDVIGLIDAVTILDTQTENSDCHYFEVVLKGIEQGSEELLEFKTVKDYLSQVAPVPIDYKGGMVLQKINQTLEEYGKEPEEFKIYLREGEDVEQIHKPYSFAVTVGSKKEFIEDIYFFHGDKDDGALFFLGWYGETKLSGMIDETVSGLRVRKRNILIGDNRTLDEFFWSPTYHRFNRWYVGEIYVFDENLIPNARRDDFEKNETYFAFRQKVEKTAKDLARLAHSASKQRNEDKKAQKIMEEKQEIEQELSNDSITDTRKEQLLAQVENLTQEAEKIKPDIYPKPKPSISTDPNQANIISEKPIDTTDGKAAEKIEEMPHSEENIFSELEELKNKIKGNKNHVSKQLPSTISRNCRKEIDKIFNVIDSVLSDKGQVRELKNRIIEELQQQPKKGKNT